MKQIGKLRARLLGLNNMITRYPLTVVFLLAATIINGLQIHKSGEDYNKYLITFMIGALLSAVFQVVYERFFQKESTRLLLMIGVAVLTVGYYLIIRALPTINIEVGVRTIVASFALLIAFLWVPVIRSKISFNESFMAAFKGLFIAAFFSGIIFIGVSIIFAATDLLISNVNYKYYLHIANIVFILFGPIYFLSLTPIYPGEKKINNEKEIIHEDLMQRATNCPKYLEILISYIIIPLTAVFTIILVIYIVRNIGGKFWTNNLLEPLLVAFSITVILVYILASRLNNKFASLFRMVFPKVLVPIVSFQTIASILKIGEEGVTYGRYYVILFGLFAAVAGILFCIIPVRKNGIVAALLIVISCISVVPPVDAFTLSKVSQVSMLKRVLLRNNMLEKNSIKPNALIPDQDKQQIIKSVNYLNMMEYTDNIDWLVDYDEENNFSDTFGFNEYDLYNNEYQYSSTYLKKDIPISIAGYDTFVATSIIIDGNKQVDTKINNFVISNINYTLSKSISADNCIIKIQEDNKQDVITIETIDIFKTFDNDGIQNEIKSGNEISSENATFSKENDLAKITLVIQNISVEKSSNKQFYYVDLYILVHIK